MANELIGTRRELFMGNAQQVPRPALPGPAPVPAPAPIAAAPVPAAAPVSAAPAVAGRAEKLGRAAGGLARRIGPTLGKIGATAPLTGFGDYQINDPDVDSSLSGTIGYALDGQGGKVVDSLRKGAVEAGLDAASGVAKTVDGIGGVFGLNPGLSGKLSGAVRADLGQNVTAPVVNAPQTALNASGGLVKGQTAPTVPGAAALAGTPLYGQEGVRKVLQPNGNPLYTNATSNEQDAAFMKSKGTLSTSSFDPAAAQRSSDLASQISLMRAGLRDRGDKDAYLKGAIGVASLQPGGASQELQDQIAKITKGGRYLTAAGAANVSDLLKAGQNNERQGQELAQRGRIADQSADIAREGQDVTLRGQDMNARTAAVAARQKQMQDDREFGLKSEELGLRRGEAGAKRDSEDFQQRDTATKALAARFKAQFPGPDGDAKVAERMQGVQAALGNRVAVLQKQVQLNGPNAKQAQAEIDLIQRKGPAALDEKALATLESQSLTRDRSKETAGWFGGNHVDSNNPDDFQVIGREGSMLKLRGGGTIRENDVKYDEKGNILMPNWFKNKSNNFDLAKGFKQ